MQPGSNILNLKTKFNQKKKEENFMQQIMMMIKKKAEIDCSSDLIDQYEYAINA